MEYKGGTCKLTMESNKIAVKNCNNNIDISSKLSSSNSLVSETSTISCDLTLSESGDDSDYGLYEDLEDDSSIKSKTGTVAAIGKSLSKPNASNLVIYTVKNSHAHTSCRSFEKKTDKTSSVCISMTGVRIVQDSSGVHAEYHVKMVLGLVEYNTWKTFDDFQEIAKACLEFSNKKMSIWPSIFAILIAKKNVCKISRGSTRLTKTIKAWNNVILERSKRSWFKQISVSSLMAESNALQFFLECLLFEIPNIDILLEFLTSN